MPGTPPAVHTMIFKNRLFYTSTRYPRLDAENNLTCDMHFSDLSESQIRELFPARIIIGRNFHNENIHFFTFRSLGFLFTNETTVRIFNAVSDHFRRGPDFVTMPDYVDEFTIRNNKEAQKLRIEAHGHDYFNFSSFNVEGSPLHWRQWRTDFESRGLTSLVFTHPHTIRFVEGIKRMIDKIINERHGDLTGSNGLGSKDMVDRARVIMAHRDYGVMRPIFNRPQDITSGLQLLIHDVHAWRVEFKELRLTTQGHSGSYTGRISVTLFDHFGLDKEDIQNYAGSTAGFRSWFILQRYNFDFNHEYKPFVTRMTREFDISGVFTPS